MSNSEHLLHGSKTEIRLQWIAIGCMALGLITSIYFHMNLLKTERVESELTSYLHLNDKYNKLLFTLISNDPHVFQKADELSLQKNKYIMYELFELFATVDSLGSYFKELNKDVWTCWARRREFLFSKPAIRYAWQVHLLYADHIYSSEFVAHIQTIMAHEKHLEEPALLKTEIVQGRDNAETRGH